MCFCEEQLLSAMGDCQVTDSRGFAGNSASSMQRLQNLTSGRKSILVKYLMQKGGDSLSNLSEYLGVALAFTALGSLMKKTNENNSDCKGKARYQRMALEAMLNRAMDRLRDLAMKAHNLEETVTEMRVAQGALVQEKEALQSEKVRLLQKVADAETEVMELRNRRLEDAIANDKIVALLSSKEQAWTLEQTRLCQEIDSLEMDLNLLRSQLETMPQQDEHHCELCLQKESAIADLSEKLGERELLIKTTMEEAKLEQHERNELAVKLAIAEIISGDLREKLTREVEEHRLDHQKYQSLIADMKAKKEEMEIHTEKLLKELDLLKEAIAENLDEKRQNDVLLHKISKEVLDLRKEVDDKEKMISAMLRKENAAAEENKELARELALVKTKTRNIEVEKEKWKRKAEERDRPVDAKKHMKSRLSIGNASDHSLTEKMTNIRQAKEIKALESQIQAYQAKILELEGNILLRTAEEQQRFSNPNEGDRGKGQDSELSRIRDAMEVDMETKKLQFSATKSLLDQHMDTDRVKEQEITKWKRLYLAAKSTVEALEEEVGNAGMVFKQSTMESSTERRATKTRIAQTTILEERHWQEIEAFERQMRARDERMEAFRWHLVKMEQEAKERQEEIETLRNKLQQAKEEKVTAECMLTENRKELKKIRERMIVYEPECCDMKDAFLTFSAQNHQITQLVQPRENNSAFSEETSRNQLRPYSQLDEPSQNQDWQPKAGEEGVDGSIVKVHMESGDTFRLKDASEFSSGDHQISVRNALGAACMEVERLSEVIAEAKEQILRVEGWQGNHLRGLIEQAAEVTRSGQELRAIKDFLLATGSDVNKQPFGREMEIPNSRKEVKQDEGGFHVHKESRIDKPFVGKSSYLSRYRASQKKVSPIDNIVDPAKSESCKISSSSITSHIVMAIDEGGRSTSSKIRKQPREASVYEKRIDNRVGSRDMFRTSR